MFDIQMLYEWIFSSFRINGIGTLVHALQKENIVHCMIIKRSWIFGLYVSGLLLFVCLIVAIHTYIVT